MDILPFRPSGVLAKNYSEVFLEKVVIIDEDEDDTEEVRNLFEKVIAITNYL